LQNNKNLFFIHMKDIWSIDFMCIH
jgi:hypothetical protein